MAPASIEARGQDRLDVDARRAVEEHRRRVGGSEIQVDRDGVSLPRSDPVERRVDLEALLVVAAYDSVDVIASHRGAVGGQGVEEGGQIDPAVRVQLDAHGLGAVPQHQ